MKILLQSRKAKSYDAGWQAVSASYRINLRLPEFQVRRNLIFTEWKIRIVAEGSPHFVQKA